MPELPEVETIRRQLAPWLTGKTVTAVTTAPTARAEDVMDAVGQTVTAVRRRGKYLLLDLTAGDELSTRGGLPAELIIHLGMTGTLARSAAVGRHVQVVLALTDGEALAFRDPRRFGRVVLRTRGDHRGLPTLAAMGPAPLDDAFTPAVFGAGLRARAGIKGLLLSQRPVAGLGNIYADEALWCARIHPRSAACALSARKVSALHGAVVSVLRAALDSGGTTLRDYQGLDGARGRFSGRLQVYGRGGQPCLRCNRPLTRSVVAGRGTHHCARCQRRVRAPRQPAPAPPARRRQAPATE